MITEEDVVVWMQNNPEKFREIHLRFMFGAAAGELQQIGYSPDAIRNMLEMAMAVSVVGYQKITGTSLRAVPSVPDKICKKCGRTEYYHVPMSICATFEPL